MKTEFNSTEINENQVRLNGLDWSGGKNVPRATLISTDVMGKKPKGVKVFSIRLNQNGETKNVEVKDYR